MNVKSLCLWIGIPLALVGMFFFGRAFSGGEEMQPVEQAARRAAGGRRARSPRAAKIAERRAMKASPRSVTEMRVKPVLMALEADEEAELTEMGRALLKELQEALDFENFKDVARLVAKLQDVRTASGSDDAVPAILRRKAIEALGWFGAEAVPELLAFLADSDPDISQAALDQLMLALEDVTLGDADRSVIVKQIAEVMTDGDGLDQIMMEIANMRHSRALDTILHIFKHGTPEAIAKMPEWLEFITGEELTTVEDVMDWYERNPDGEDDEDFFGPMSTK